MNFALTRKLIIFGLVLPLAAIIGFSLATPYDRTTLLLVGLVTALLLMPIMLKWYHQVLIFTWNAFITVYFLPGRPDVWMLVATIGLGIVVLNNTFEREKTLIHVPALTIPLLFFITVVLVTAKLTGGMGLRSLGGGQLGAGAIGGRGYYTILFAAFGYFVFTSRAIPIERAKTYLSVFFLSGATALVSNLAYMLGPGFYFLFYLFPVEMALSQAFSETLGFGGWGIVRIPGASAFGTAVYFMMMSRYGIRGIFDIQKPWRLVIFVPTVILGLLGGYRTQLVTYIVHFGTQFYFERLFRTRLCAILLVGGLLAAAVTFPFIEKMPLSIQRCFAFVPGVEVSHMAQADAENSTRWRTEMWTLLLPEIPRYLILGKGYAVKAADIYLTDQAQRRGIVRDYEVSIVSGNYHSGPLSLIIPFGIFGILGFIWFISAGWWVLYRNYRYGDPALQLINTFLLAYFITRLLLFCFIFGAVEVDMFRFTGILGMSVAINRGVRKPADVPALEPVPVNLQPATA